MKILMGMPSPDSWGGPIACEPPVVDALRPMVEELRAEVYVYGDKKRATPTIMRVKRVLKTAFRFRKLIRNGDFDVVHLNTAFDRRSVLRDAASIFLIGRTRARYFLKIHGASPEQFAKRSMLFDPLIRFLRSRVSGFGVHTVEEIEGLESIGLDRSRFHVMRNAIVVNNAKPDGFVRAQKEPDETFRFLFASRFIDTKGVLETIKACSILKQRGVQFTLKCVGDGPLKARADALVSELELGGSIDLTGYIPAGDLDRLFFETDIFVFPTSHAEGFPIVLFNAVAAGMPVVTTRTRAANDHLSEPANCLFCTAQPENIADRLAELIGSKELRTAMSQENVRFGESLSPARMAEEYLEIYERIMAQ